MAGQPPPMELKNLVVPGEAGSMVPTEWVMVSLTASAAAGSSWKVQREKPEVFISGLISWRQVTAKRRGGSYSRTSPVSEVRPSGVLTIQGEPGFQVVS